MASQCEIGATSTVNLKPKWKRLEKGKDVVEAQSPMIRDLSLFESILSH